MAARSTRIGLVTVAVVAIGALAYALGIGLPLAAVAGDHADDVDDGDTASAANDGH